jgi:hypothetical protein
MRCNNMELILAWRIVVDERYVTPFERAMTV